MKNKRGQFYLIAALIIIVILGSFATLYFRNGEESTSKIYDLREELNIESENVLDYGTYNNKNAIDLIENFSEDYADYKGEGKSIVFIYGNNDDIYQLTYDEATRGGVSLSSGSSLQISGSEENKERLNIQREGNKRSVNVKFSENITREIELSEGENFYFIISEETEDETYIAESSDSENTEAEENEED